MKHYSKAIFIIFALLLVFSFAQRGGSRSRSPSSSGSSTRYPSRSGSFFGFFGAQGNCTTIKGTTTCTYEDGETSWTDIFVIFGILAVICVWAIRSVAKDKQRRKTVIDSVMKQFQMNMQQFTSQLSPEDKNKLIDQFMKKSYTMVINVKDNAQKFFCQVKVTDLKKENQNKYTIKMDGSDEVGKSQIEGLLMFKNDGLSLRLSKVYADRKKAEQTGQYDIILYEGEGLPAKITGQWAFHGHQTSLKYSGSWSMMQL